MRLLTHNTLRNNATASKGRGWPLEITATEIRVDDSGDVGEDAERESAFIKGVLGVIDWPTLVQGASQMGLSTLPPTLTEELASDPVFLKALYHVLMNVHLVRGVLTCPDTGREFPVTNGVPNFMLDEEECENVRA
uniref:Multifunctional methyltransferase subunit TRM112-like protein n=1 Tax=Odontella aurita TaxID=265563 RepID=A0A7S4NDH4_9STRA|mmetsp:Transcript_58763/g.174852  ORF Transcript_58763/g.174852 Transcript_58763/m.174852 type:complete len:136 (+) Transcript_58763:258-665(+)|eukprot:CAMPEP_0113551104 /NCGR_PEP_ID=MMETSP0015_2-20120614/14343_1 /TAXON_ID=2838 /ORGANISM="Odontella" /LENGTH=135 /DNA_ID=CAMNT_0000451967 /DNA_START=195 /DNA_END=602 /DNA_ORIENTATION=+ /assembly_acc=CAM_ASM_000160